MTPRRASPAASPALPRRTPGSPARHVAPLAAVGPVTPVAAVALAAVASAALGLLLPDVAAAWGGRTHEIINRRAVLALDGDAGAAWHPLAASLGMHASDADHRKSADAAEPARHYLDADAFDRPPFAKIPRTWEGMLRKYGPTEARSFGVAPWAVDECYRMVVASLRRGDWSSAGAWAADLGHYVGDTHEPLHCTVNYDGQRTGHDGIHIRWEVHMMDHHFDEAVLPADPAVPRLEGTVTDACFRWIAEAYAGLDPLLAAETAARAVDPTFGAAYEAALWEHTADLAGRQVASAVTDLAMLLEAAWTEAGSPPGPGSPLPLQALPVASLTAAEGPRDGLPFRALGLAALALAGTLLAAR